MQIIMKSVNEQRELYKANKYKNKIKLETLTNNKNLKRIKTVSSNTKIKITFIIF